MRMDKYIAIAAVFLAGIGGLSAQQNGVPEQPQAQLSNFEDLVYPPIARVARIEGVVVIKAQINSSSGDVISAMALNGPALLVSASLANVKKWKFKPNSGNTAIIVYDFEIRDGACHDDSHSLFLLKHPNLATIVSCTPVIR